ncbi:hypothetical protein [Bremerella sp.]|uniref:hypothetical protein n=1 Tax=Bremerella sp. TaxID=2795602 RepID=UPI0039195188
MKLYEKMSDRDFHTSILTTFAVDFDSYESIALSRLRGSGCRNNILLVDQGMLVHALSGDCVLPQSAGRNYTVRGISGRGAFHPKVLLQLGPRKGRLIVSSANATASGLAGNLEIAGIIECDQFDSPEQQIVAAGWHYLRHFLDQNSTGIRQQISWMTRRTPWLSSEELPNRPIELPDTSEAAFLASNRSKSILHDFVAQVGSEYVDRLILLSPYWDKDLSTLKKLQERLNPRETLLLVDSNKELFPTANLSTMADVRILDINSFAKKRFVHAKLLLAETNQYDHVLFGSANCTFAALGNEATPGINHEACLYRRLAPGETCQSLNLADLIESAEFIDPSSMPDYVAGEDLPLKELANTYPGDFELEFDRLTWRPTHKYTQKDVAIEFLSEDKTEIAIRLIEEHSPSSYEKIYRIDGYSANPAFARVRTTDGIPSSLAVVTCVYEIRRGFAPARGAKSKSAELLLDHQTEEGIWLLEVLEDLESSQNTHAARSSARNRTETQRSDSAAPQFETLAYSDFVRNCRLRSENSSIERNSLAQSDVSLVRSFLNRVISLPGDQDVSAVESNEDAIIASLDLRDELIENEELMDFSESTQGISVQSEEGQSVINTARRRNQNRAQIRDATQKVVEQIRNSAERGHLTSLDLIRLRAMLAIILVTAQPIEVAREPVNALDDSPLDGIRVMPAIGEEPTWTRLLSKLLFALFGGPKPSIRQLQVESFFDQIPDDFLECWAYCYWAINAVTLATKRQPICGTKQLINRVYDLTGMANTDKELDQIEITMSHLDNRFAERIGFEKGAVIAAHKVHSQGIMTLPH